LTYRPGIVTVFCLRHQVGSFACVNLEVGRAVDVMYVLLCIFSQLTSEMRDDEPIVRHLVPFEATFTRGSVIAVQFGAECKNGYVQPVPRLLNLTPDLDLCIEHRTDAVKCFAQLATEKVLDTYESIEHYQVSLHPLCFAVILSHCFF